jgi:cell fate regulator YaaT (PSP1 superfamily)
MISDKPEKKISYFPRAWGSPRKDGSGKQPPQPEEEKEFSETVDQAATPQESREQSQAFADESSPAEEREPAVEAHEASCPCFEEAVCRSSYVDPHDSCDDAEPLDAENLALDDEPLSWLDEGEPEIAGPEEIPEPEGSFDAEIARIKVNILGIRFGYACRIYHFDAGDLELSAGDWVLVKTEKGLGLGQVAVPPTAREISATQLEGLRKVIRKATKADLDQKVRCAQRETEAYSYCQEMIDTLSLPMKLVATECFFDGSKYVFYFTAEGRVDFRELVKMLVARFPVRIEMRQIGVRHEAKMTGGLACCGEELCCSRFLTDFRPVSVKMAKTQNLSLNPAKISGVCGRLMCCLAYEYDIYEEFRKGLPKVGKKINTPKGEGLVLKHDPLTETILVRVDEETTLELTKEQILCEEPLPPQKRSKKKA